MTGLKGKSLGEVYEAAAKVDPYIWHCMYRRVKNQVSTLDVSAKVRAAMEKYGDERPRELVKLLIRHRPFLIQPMRDETKYKSYLKSRQVGVSETQITECLSFLDNHPNTKWMHTFHREKAATDFSKTRYAPALKETERIKSIVGAVNGVETRQISDSYLFIRSTWSEGMGEGTDLDVITFDEYDRMRDGVEIAFKEGLESSAYGWIRYVSTPSLPGRGVDVPWQISNQYHWFNKCTKCGLAQTITYPENYVQVKDIPPNAVELPEGTYEFLCRKESCRGKLDRVVGEWVAKYPDRSSSGYYIPQAIFMRHTCTSLMEKKRSYRFPALWTNYVLGLPSKGSSVLLQSHHLENASADYKFPVPRRTRDFDKITVGIDWGGGNWVVVLGVSSHNGKMYVLDCFCVEDVEGEELQQVREIISRIEPYAPDIIVADDGYGKDRNPFLYKAYPKKFWISRYNPQALRRQTSVETKWMEKDRRVIIDRTMALKQLCNEIKLLDIGFPADNTEDTMNMKRHLLALIPKVEEEDGKVWEVIVNSGRPDHLAHALLYARLGQEKLLNTGSFDFRFMCVETQSLLREYN